MKLKRKLLSLLLMFVLLCTSIAGYGNVFAEINTEKQLGLSTDMFESAQTGISDNIGVSESIDTKVDELVLPDIVKQEEISANFVSRAKANSIKTVFSKELKEGITLQADNVNIRLVSNKATDGKLSEDNKTVTYIYDNKTTIEYSQSIQAFFDDVTDTVARCYKHYFDINLVMMDGGVSYDSLVDQCPLGDNAYCNGSCQTGDDYRSSHHKDIVSISDQLYNDERKDNHIYFLWNKRGANVYCTHEDGSHEIYLL